MEGKPDVQAGILRMFDYDAGLITRIDHVIAADPYAIARWTYSAPGGERSVRGCDVFEFRDGLIASKDAFRKAAP